MKGFSPDKAHMLTLAQKVESAFADLRGKTVLFLDYPLHNNVGDWLIYHGAMKLLASLDCRIQRQYCLNDYKRLLTQSIPKDWVILLHGGGNFGDIYPQHQQLRKDVIQAFPDNKIVAMPQSVHYSDAELFRQEADLYRQHRGLTMHVRDLPSQTLLLSELPGSQVKLTPDMASVLLGNWQWQPEGKDTLYFRRRDCEATALSDTVTKGFDWDELFTPKRRRVIRQIHRLVKLENKFNLNLGAAFCWSNYTQHMLRYAFSKFAPYQTVDTDRLHGMIFATLLGKRVLLRDNSYGKIERYTQLWFADWLSSDAPEQPQTSCSQVKAAETAD